MVPQVADQLSKIREMLHSLEETEQQINDQIPGDVVTFSVAGDVFPSETIFSGRFCEGWDPKRGVPRWWEFLALHARLLEAEVRLGAEARVRGRKMALPDATITDRGDGVYKLVLSPTIIRPSPVRARAGCAAGVVIPPENVWFMARVKDVIAFGSSESILREVLYLQEFPDSGRSYLSRPWVRLDAPANAVAASLDLHPLENYLVRLLEMQGSPVTILQRYLTLTALDRMNGTLALPSKDLLQVETEIRYQPSQLAEGISDVYALRPRTPGLVRGSPASRRGHVRRPPAPDAAAPPHPGDLRRHSHARRPRSSGTTTSGAWASTRTSTSSSRSSPGSSSDTAAIAVGPRRATSSTASTTRTSTPTPTLPDPNWPALAMMVRLKTGVLPAELDAYLAERVPLLGGQSELEKVEYRGLTYTRIEQEMKIADYATDEAGVHPRAGSLHLREQRDATSGRSSTRWWTRRRIRRSPSDPTFRSHDAAARRGDAPHASSSTWTSSSACPRIAGPVRSPGASSGISATSGCVTNRHPRTRPSASGSELQAGRTRSGHGAPRRREERRRSKRGSRSDGTLDGAVPGASRRSTARTSAGYGRLRAFGAAIRAERPSLEGAVRAAARLPRARGRHRGRVVR